MRKLLLSLILGFALSLCLLTPSQATTINGPAPHFVTEDNIEINSEVNGDIILIGQNIKVTDPINGDLFVIAENVLIDAPINGDLRAIASTIEVQSTVSGSFAFISEKVSIPVTGEIRTDAYGIASKFALYGRIGRELNLGYADNADILIEGNVVGNIHYLNSMPNITDEAFLGGKLVQTDVSDFEMNEQDMRLQIILGKILHSLSLIFITVLLTRFFPKIFAKGFELYKKNIQQNLIYGILSLVIIPFILFILLVSAIGIPVALIGIALIIFLIYISPIYIATFIGQKILPNARGVLIQSICGIFIFDVISMGPVIGSILYLAGIITFIGLIFKAAIDFRKVNLKTTK